MSLVEAHEFLSDPDTFIPITLLSATFLGGATSWLLCRSDALHRRPDRQGQLGAAYLVCLTMCALVIFRYDVEQHASFEIGAVFAGLIFLLAGAIPVLRRVISFAMVDVERHDRVRIDGVEGTVEYVAWTGLDLRTEEGELMEYSSVRLVGAEVTRLGRGDDPDGPRVPMARWRERRRRRRRGYGTHEET